MSKSIKGLSLVLALAAVLVLAGVAQQADDTVTCPVTGKVMKKAEAGASAELDGKTYYFCCEDCKAKFLKDLAAFLKAKTEAQAAYVCPMCKGVASDKPGKCPKCGMALVEKTMPHAGAHMAAMAGSKGHAHGLAAGAAKTCDPAGCGQAEAAGCGKSAGMMKAMPAHGAEGCACPMCSADVDIKVENTKDGVSVTMTAKTPEQVKAIQEHAAKMKEDRAKCLEAKKDAPKK